ncbi:MAG: class I SAM-dependent methyltransferase, partial [Atopobiaceae bacterium]|nr:class I SAM-dependent methyltransferase [Atopobiaceae bacterium]
MDFQATCPTGLEDLLADELRALGAEQVRPLKGQVAFSGTLGTGFSACLRSHLASRIILVLARVDAPDADALYASLREIAWEDQIDPRTSFMVDAHGTNARLKNTQFIAERSKDAIVDRIFARRGARPSVDRERPGTVVSLRIRGDRAAVGIVLTGGRPLFSRGLGRRQSGIRSDYAAALIRMSGWDGASPIALITQGEALACECALIGEHVAPGLLRPSIGCESWGGFDAALAERIREQAEAERTDSRAPIIVLARNGHAARMRTALRELGLSSQLVSASDPSGFADASALVLDASWVFEDALAQEIALCDQVEQALAACPQASCAILFSHAGLAATLGAEVSESRTVPLGRSDAVIEVVGPRLLTPRPRISCPAPDGTRHDVAVSVPGSEQFAARLAKVARERRKWAAREDVSCYRVYDADLPDYALSIERYGDADGRGSWLALAEYAPPASVDPSLARRRLGDALAIAPVILGVDPAQVSLRTRTRARGGSQYADEGSEIEHAVRIIEEGGLEFEVDFGRRLDCGIFLDHRDTRAELREMMKQAPQPKRFLNLFAYTGTATCYAADGGALETT